MQLTECHMLKLSEYFDNEADLLKLAVSGLKMHGRKVKKHLNKEDITISAFKVLSEWYKSQPDAVVAYFSLCQALKNVEMGLYINEVFKEDAYSKPLQ